MPAYLFEFEEQAGAQSFLGSLGLYPQLQGTKPNLYKCFITRSWEIGSEDGVVGLIHPEGVFDDANGGTLRAAIYPRLRHHYHFRNELKLFDILNTRQYGVCVYGLGIASSCQFFNIAGLFHPSTIDGCHSHDGLGAVPGIKTDDDEWDLRPHRSRLVTVNQERLALFARLYDDVGTPAEQARLAVAHSEEIIRVLEKLAIQPRKLGDLSGDYFATQHWNETNAQDDGTIRRDTRYPNGINEWILSGPHFFVGNPFQASPRVNCSHNKDYDDIDLLAVPDDYMPRTNYVPACSLDEYCLRTPTWNGNPVTKFFRIAFRNMLRSTGERTLIACIIPKDVAHIHGVILYAARTDTSSNCWN